MSISSEVNRIQANVTNALTAISNKGVALPEGAKSDNLATLIDSIDTSGPLVQSDVNFYDYDGTLLYSYTLNKMQSLSALPDLPSHSGLICQGWNWTLSQLKTENKKMNVGAMYTTTDGKTRLYITIAEYGRMTISLFIVQSVAYGVTIDWGDGSETQTLSGTGSIVTSHVYTAIGDYIISLDATSGTLGLGKDSSNNIFGNNSTAGIVYANMLKKVEIGNNVPTLSYSFLGCGSVKTITIPNTVTTIVNYGLGKMTSLSAVIIPNSMSDLGTYALQACTGLRTISLPSGLASIGKSALSSCSSLTYVRIPKSVTFMDGNIFYSNSSLIELEIPDGITTLATYLCSGCVSMKKISLPDSITTIEDHVFYNCYVLDDISTPNVISIGTYAFGTCNSLHHLNIPKCQTIASSAFYPCNFLSELIIPEGVTVLNTQTFYGCYSLVKLTIPSTVTSIATSVFTSCYGMAEFHFLPTTPPTLAATSAFTGVMTDCKFYVPAASLDAYKTATNWSTYASRMVGE